MTARRLLSALLFALVGSAIFTFWLSRKFGKTEAPAPHQQYVALVKSLDAGETLQKANLRMVDWPSAAPVEGAYSKLDDVAGRTLLYPVSSGEPVLDHQLSAPGSAAGLAPRIPDGMRAISLRTDQIVGVAGFLLPGTRVDVLVTFRNQGMNTPTTSTVLQDAQILTAGQKMQPDPEGKATPVDVVTLLVAPIDAERVVLASMQGTVHFVLRNGSDHAHVQDQIVALSSLSGSDSSSRAAGPMPMPTRPSNVVNTSAARSASVASVTAGPKPYVVQTVSGDKQRSESFQ